jgi:hypothetical protein
VAAARGGTGGTRRKQTASGPILQQRGRGAHTRRPAAEARLTAGRAAARRCSGGRDGDSLRVKATVRVGLSGGESKKGGKQGEGMSRQRHLGEEEKSDS